MSKSSSSDRELHWQKTKTLTMLTLIIWYFFSFEIHLWGEALNTASFLARISWLAKVTGSICILVFWFANRQDKLDQEYGLQNKEI